METQSSVWTKLYAWKVHHILMWACYYIFWVLVYLNYYPSINPLLITTGIYLVFNAISFYTIAYFLVNRFLWTGRLKIFIAIAFFVLVLCSCGLSLSLYLLFRDIRDVTDNFQFIVIGTFSSTLLTTSFLTAIKLVLERLGSERISKQVESQRLESELQYLKAQVNPHFLFNAINSVYILIKKDPQLASETLIKLSDLLRFQLYDCSVDSIAIEKEMEYVGNFIGLEKLRRGEKVTVDVGRDGNLTGFYIAPFLLMPFLENTFKHVSNRNDKANEIRIGFRKSEGEFMATFFNTTEQTSNNNVGGIGLKNVKRRLALLYPDKHSLDIQQTQDYFQVTLHLNLL